MRPDDRDTSPADVLVVDAQHVFRRGVVATLDRAEGIGRVDEVGSLAEAWSHPGLGEADVVLLDARLDGVIEFVGELLDFTDTRVLALGAASEGDRHAELAEAGAMAVLERESLTPEVLVLGIRAARTARGSSLAVLPGSLSVRVREPRGPDLSAREQQVLALVADGLPTREIALQLSYSERTVKKVLGDVVVKLGARSRSQAIARAVRQGLI